MSLQDDLAKLSEAHGPKALAKAFAMLQGTLRAARRKAATEYGVLAQTVAEAMRIWDAQKADGVSLAERVAGMEKTLRMAWPQTREWKFLCERCSDTGWECRICTPESRCGRPFRFPQQRADDYTGQGHCGAEHTYVVPCWCEKGRGFRAGLMKEKPMVTSDDYAAAGKTKAMTRAGR